MDNPEQRVRELFIEAASVCGDDVEAIVLFVERRLASMSEDDRQSVMGVGRRILAYCEPTERPGRSH